jgi:hypothetical protein
LTKAFQQILFPLFLLLLILDGGEGIDHIDHTGFVDGDPGMGPVDKNLRNIQFVGTQFQADPTGFELGQGDEVFGLDAVLDFYIVDA